MENYEGNDLLRNASNAIQGLVPGDWIPVGENIVYHNNDGTYSVTDNSEQVDCTTIEGAVAIVMENHGLESPEE